jgi:ribulose-phosphate 3-epimerase
MIRSRHLECEVEVDGGIYVETAPRVVEAGADVLVAGSAAFDSKEGVVAAIRNLLRSATRNPRS